jgi:cyanophycinase
VAEDEQGRAMSSYGTLALVGGGEWQEGASFDEELVALGGSQVLVLPTAAAYEHPESAVEFARGWFAPLGAKVQGAMVLSRADAEDEGFAEQVRSARFIYLAGGSPMHLRAVLKDSLVFDALLSAWRSGAVVAGSSAGAMVLTDPMVDPRGGAFTVGLGLVRNLAVTPHFTGEVSAQLRRTLSLTPEGCALVAIGEQSALLRDPDGTWRRAGRGRVEVFVDGEAAELDALAGKATA